MAEYQNNRSSRPERPRYQTVPTDATGKLPPRDIELERAVLGALMLEKDAYAEVSEILVPESFYEPAHQKIYSAIVGLSLEQKPVDFLTVTDRLRQENELEAIGGPPYIVELTAGVTSAANIEYHARLVAQKYLARRLITFASQIEGKAFDESQDVDDLLQEAEGSLFEISRTQLKREVVQIDTVLSQAYKQMQQAAAQDSGLSGLPSGFEEIDKVTGGWQNSDLIIIAARPAMGKTAFALTMAKNMAMDYGIPVGVFSLEMSSVQLVNRLISNVCETPSDKIKSGNFSTAEWTLLNTRLNDLYGKPIYLDETPGLSVTELRTKALRLVREHGIKVIMIDYLQLMTATGMKFGNREQEVSTISRSLKALAKELNIPVVALSQLSRQNESREDKRPMLSDLRESGAIEQDADIVCFIHRPEYYTKSAEDATGRDIRGLAEFLIAKHRSGSTKDVDLRFVPQYTKFEDWNKGQITVRQTLEKAAEQQRTPSRHNSSAKAKSNDTLRQNGPMPEQAGQPMPDILPGPSEKGLPF